MLVRVLLPHVPPSVTQSKHCVSIFSLVGLQNFDDVFPFLDWGRNEFEGIQKMMHIQIPFSPNFEGNEINSQFLALRSSRVNRGNTTFIHHHLQVMINPEFVNRVRVSIAELSETHDRGLKESPQFLLV